MIRHIVLFKLLLALLARMLAFQLATVAAISGQAFGGGETTSDPDETCQRAGTDSFRPVTGKGMASPTNVRIRPFP